MTEYRAACIAAIGFSLLVSWGAHLWAGWPGVVLLWLIPVLGLGALGCIIASTGHRDGVVR